MPITHIIHSITQHNNIFCSLVTPLHISAFMKRFKKLIKASKLSTCIDGNTTPKYELTFNAYICDDKNFLRLKFYDITKFDFVVSFHGSNEF